MISHWHMVIVSVNSRGMCERPAVLRQPSRQYPNTNFVTYEDLRPGPALVFPSTSNVVQSFSDIGRGAAG
jgi:hypothetical protein